MASSFVWPWLALALSVAAVSGTNSNNDQQQRAGLDGVLRLDLPAGTTSGYHGLIDEDKLVVDVTPKIRALGADLCTFRIVNKHRGETPFEVVMKDREKGEAELRARKTLNCEKKKNYKFDIVAVSCSGVVSDK